MHSTKMLWKNPAVMATSLSSTETVIGHFPDLTTIIKEKKLQFSAKKNNSYIVLIVCLFLFQTHCNNIASYDRSGCILKKRKEKSTESS